MIPRDNVWSPGETLSALRSSIRLPTKAEHPYAQKRQVKPRPNRQLCYNPRPEFQPTTQFAQGLTLLNERQTEQLRSNNMVDYHPPYCSALKI